jgi:hypothetical protein
MSDLYQEKREPLLPQVIGAIGNLLLLMFFIIGVLAVVMLFVRDGVWVQENIYPIVQTIAGISLFTVFPLSLLLTIFRKTRGISGLLLFIESYIFGFSLWLFSLIILNLLGGRIGVIIGLVFAGIGVIPVAIIASALHGYWSTAGEILLAGILIILARYIGGYLVAKSAESDYDNLEYDSDVV